MGSSSVMKRLPSPLYELRHSIAAGPRRALGAHGVAAADEAAVVARAARGDPDLIALGEHAAPLPLQQPEALHLDLEPKALMMGQAPHFEFKRRRRSGR